MDVVLSYSYLPAANFVGDLEVTFVVSDSKGPGVGGSATLNISPVNDTPTPTYAIDQIALEAGQLVSGQLTADDIEIITGEELDSSLTYSLSGDAISGLVINEDGSFTFDPTDPAYEYLALVKSRS